MMDCWHDDPSRRPPFQDIVIRLSRLLTRVLAAEERRRQALAAAALGQSGGGEGRARGASWAGENTPLTVTHQLSSSLEFVSDTPRWPTLSGIASEAFFKRALTYLGILGYLA